MAHYRVTFDGVIEGDYETAEAAAADLVEFMSEGTLDDLVVVEEYDMEKKEWVRK
jgi:hypothetical protein